MNVGHELQAIRQRLRELDATVGQVIHHLEAQREYDNYANSKTEITEMYEVIYPLTVEPSVFKGETPIGVLFGESDRVDVRTWKMVLQEILYRCNAEPEKHTALMNLRGKVSGRKRMLLAGNPYGMRSPLKIADDLYIETHYDTETLLRILMTRILDVVGYNYRHISVAIRNSKGW
jgi:hypothetical protein